MFPPRAPFFLRIVGNLPFLAWGNPWFPHGPLLGRKAPGFPTPLHAHAAEAAA